MIEFSAPKVCKQFYGHIEDFYGIVARNQPELHELKEGLNKELDDFEKRGFLTIALIGEYSAGKSTIISALTGDRDIKISADIATDKITKYKWNGIELIDTPGLWTQHKDHDHITYNAIRQADLLLFCLTHSLFDNITLKSFKDLAYEQGYKNKIMMIVNKMSSEAGDRDERIKNYEESLDLALHPNSDFTVCFIDALDFIEGNEEKDNELIKLSNFSAFIEKLNIFVKNKKIIAKLDTPIHIFLDHLKKATEKLNRNPAEDNAHKSLLEDITDSIDKNKKMLKLTIDNLSIDTYDKIVEIGNDFSKNIAKLDVEDFKKKLEKAKLDLEEIAKDVEKSIKKEVEDSIERIEQELKEIYNSPLAKAFCIKLNIEIRFNLPNYEYNSAYEEFSKKFSGFQDKAQSYISSIKEAATGPKATNTTGLLNTTQVSGSSLHKGVLSAGRFLGYKFPPWGAITFAKNLGNAVAFAGPVLGVFSVYVEAKKSQEEKKNEENLAKAQYDIKQQFKQTAETFETEINSYKIKIDEYFKPVEDEINKDKTNLENLETQSKENINKLLGIQESLHKLIKSLNTV